MPESVDEWAEDFSDAVGVHVRDGWVKCENREQAERMAADLLDGKVMHRTVTPWAPAGSAWTTRDTEAFQRVREYLIARDEFYGREASDDDVIDSVDQATDVLRELLLSDLRALTGAPAPETYDDRTEAFWAQSDVVSPPGQTGDPA